MVVICGSVDCRTPADRGRENPNALYDYYSAKGTHTWRVRSVVWMIPNPVQSIAQVMVQLVCGPVSFKRTENKIKNGADDRSSTIQLSPSGVH